MKILYSFQATGNGHLIRAREIIPELKRFGPVHIMTSGSLSQLPLEFPIDFQHPGLSYRYNDKGGINYSQTLKDLELKPLFKAINELPVEDYDLVINDYEPITAYACKRKGVKCVSISNQMSHYSTKIPRPKHSWAQRQLLLNYAPANGKKIGIHYEKYDDFIMTPIIRQELHVAQPPTKDHLTVYLPAHDDYAIIEAFGLAPFPIHVFSRTAKKPYRHGRLEIKPLGIQEFTKSMVTAEGVICAGGFTTTSEAMFLGKKLWCIPIHGQYEQECNYLALKQLGLKDYSFNLLGVMEFYDDSHKVIGHFPQNIDEHLSQIISHKT